MWVVGLRAANTMGFALLHYLCVKPHAQFAKPFGHPADRFGRWDFVDGENLQQVAKSYLANLGIPAVFKI